MCFEITAYSNHFASTGKNPGDKDFGLTAIGVKTVEGVTIAADPKVLPYGTKVYIDRVGHRIVQDKKFGASEKYKSKNN